LPGRQARREGEIAAGTRVSRLVAFENDFSRIEALSLQVHVFYESKKFPND
jgi:hypothetical protein